MQLKPEDGKLRRVFGLALKAACRQAETSVGSTNNSVTLQLGFRWVSQAEENTSRGGSQTDSVWTAGTHSDANSPGVIMSDNSLQGWSLTRTMGRPAFVRQYGILFWGIPTAILWAVAMACLSGFDHLAILLTISLVVSPFSGFCFGHMLWAINERFAPPARSRERRV